MAGVPRPDPVHGAIGGAGGGAAGGDSHGDTFAESAGGKSLSEAMGLPAVAAEGGGK